jgi:hypothetical protein
MKKTKKRTKRYNTTKAAPIERASPLEPEQPTRRDVLRRYRNRGLVLGVVGIGGWFVAQDVSATMAEHDLTRLGNGIPSIVQVHDPSCPTCTALQKEARAAMKGFDDGELQFLVANLLNAEGSRLAADNGVGKVTLLFFDGKGKRREIMRGPNSRAILEQRFQQFVGRVK